MGRCRCLAAGDPWQREGRVLGMCWRSPSPNRSVLLCVSTRGSPAGSEVPGEGAGECVILVRIVRTSSPGVGLFLAKVPHVWGALVFPLGSLLEASDVFHAQNQRRVRATEGCRTPSSLEHVKLKGDV